MGPPLLPPPQYGAAVAPALVSQLAGGDADGTPGPQDVPVSEHHGVTEALGAGFVEPLPAAVALQHLQVPPGEGEEPGDSEGSTSGSHHPGVPSQGAEVWPWLALSAARGVEANSAS